MIMRFKKAVSLLLLLIFLLPSIIKLEHHHEHFDCKVKNEKHYHSLHERCVICNFEFSVFLSESENIDLLNADHTDNYYNSYISQNFSNLSQFSFSLRGPPVV